MNIDTMSLIGELTMSRRPYPELGQLILPVPGLYSFFVSSNEGLVGTLLEGHPPSAPLYIGKAEKSLLKRDLETHFAEGTTGSSTVGRTFGALLRQSLQMVPERRGFTGKAQDFRNYRFDDQSEKRLSDWMRAHLWLGWCEVRAAPGNLVHIETAVIRAVNPPLNLTHSNHPSVGKVKATRAECRTLAQLRS